MTTLFALNADSTFDHMLGFLSSFKHPIAIETIAEYTHERQNMLYAEATSESTKQYFEVREIETFTYIGLTREGKRLVNALKPRVY